MIQGGFSQSTVVKCVPPLQRIYYILHQRNQHTTEDPVFVHASSFMSTNELSGSTDEIVADDFVDLVDIFDV